MDEDKAGRLVPVDPRECLHPVEMALHQVFAVRGIAVPGGKTAIQAPVLEGISALFQSINHHPFMISHQANRLKILAFGRPRLQVEEG